MNLAKDLSGTTINDWHLIKLTKLDDGAVYLCRCKCGFEKELKRNILITNKSKSCRKCSYENQAKKKYTGELPDRVWNHILRNANERDIEFKVDRNFIYELFLKQNRKCALSNVDIMFSTRGKKFNETTASLDRIDSTKPYTNDNVWWVHKHINMMKQSYSLEYFKELCSKVTNYEKVKSSEISREEYNI